MWPFPSHSRVVRKLAWQKADRTPWAPVSLPHELERGEPDTERPGMKYFPSVYDVPTGIRAAQTDEAWVIGWRYLQPDAGVRRWEIDANIWALEGKHSHRLLGLEGRDHPTRATVETAMNAWLVFQPEGVCSHRHILTLMKAHALDRLEQARTGSDSLTMQDR